VLGGRQLEATQVRNVGSIRDDTAEAARRRAQREAACEIIAGAAVEGTQQHAEQIKLVNVYCKCGLFLDVGVSPARRGTPHSTE